MERQLEQIARQEKERWFWLGYRLGKEAEFDQRIREIHPMLGQTERQRRLNRIKIKHAKPKI